MEKNVMKLLSLIGAAFLSVAAIGTAQAADAAAEKGGVNVGTLICHVDPGVGLLVASNKGVQCTYKPVNGKTQKYVGNFARIGIDVGFTSGGTIVWTVLAPGKLGHGALAGTYLGASVEATAVVGATANVLVGGLHKSVSLQPVSVQGNVGLSAAVAGAGLTLKAVH